MAIQKYTKIRDFNTQLMAEEVQALSPAIPAFQQSFPGFDQSGGQATPIADASRVISRNGSTILDTAVRGEVRYETRDPLTAAEVTAIDGALDAHDETGRSTEQANSDRIQTDLATLRTRLPLITDPDLELVAQLTLDLADQTF